MRVFLALALLLWASSEAHHEPGHSLKHPCFPRGKISQYEWTLNTTAGIPGMTSQLAKFSIRGMVNVMPKSDTEYLLKVEDVSISRPEAGTPTDEETLSYTRDGALEGELQKPIKFMLEDGQVKRYTLGRNESPQSKAIKRSILRHLEAKLQDQNEDGQDEYPYTYTSVKKTLSGPIKSWYVVNVSPFPEFPHDQDVYNVSKVDIYEPTNYPATHVHHNFAKQGCPEVCKTLKNKSPMENEANKYSAGCPSGYEPHKTPVRMYCNAHYNFLRQGENMVLESLTVEEKHIGSMYDQDMVIAISAEYQHKATENKQIEEPRDQVNFDDLAFDVLPEFTKRQEVSEDTILLAEALQIQESRIPEKIVELLRKMADTVVENKLENQRSQAMGENLILLQKMMSFLRPEEHKRVWSNIVDRRSYKSADEKEKIKRQILVDVLPLVGTRETLEFIKFLMTEEKLTTWEAKEILEAVPENLWKIDENVIRILEEIRRMAQVERQLPLQSAAYLAVARTLRKTCVINATRTVHPSEQLKSSPRQPISRFQRASSLFSRDDEEEEERESQRLFRAPSQIERIQAEYEMNPECPKEQARRFVEEVAQKLQSTRDVMKKIFYIQVLANTGNPRVLEYLAPYINGSVTEQEQEQWAPADIDYVQTSTLYALYHLAEFYPMEVLEYVTPIYMNFTEAPRVRIAAFTTLMRCQPPLSLLQHIAQDSWLETSNEVGSYVYTTVTSLGNSSEPCMKLMKKRIQHVISQFKNYDIGYQHAQHIVASFFDKLRNFGIEKRCAYVPSNESAIPHGLYSGLFYNLDNLKDILFQVAVNMQGIPVEKLFDMIDAEILGLRMPENIPSEKENEIFGTAKVISRMPKEMRVAIYHRIFYSQSYMFFDVKSIRNLLTPLVEHLENVFPSSGNVRKGHFVKVFIPSSMHTFSMGQAAAFPIEFEIKHPILVSMKAEVQVDKSQKEIHMKLVPCVYYTQHHTAQIWTPINKKAIGVYHEQKFTWTMPLEITGRLHEHNETVSLDIKWPEMNKRIFRYHSEAGTYASPVTFDHLPSTQNRKPIETSPIMFRKEQVLGLPTLPNVYIAAHTEDVAFGTEEMPRNMEEVMELVVKHLRNPGWRRKSINATLVSDRDAHTHYAKILLHYKTSHKSRNLQSPHEESNLNSMMSNLYEDEEEQQDRRNIQRESSSWGQESLGMPKSDAERIYKEMKQLPHVAHEMTVEMFSFPANAHVELRMEYNHTFDRKKHTVTMETLAHGLNRRSPYKVCMVHATEYGYLPSEFRYKASAYEKQQANFYNEWSWSNDCEVFRNPKLVTLGSMIHKSPKVLLSNELFDGALDEDMLMPETHEECIEDMRKGMDQSIACMKAIREQAIYNTYKIRSEWREEMPLVLRNITEKLNQAIKYTWYSQADINTLVENKKQVIEINAEYIDKLTDTPVLNIEVQTPEETVYYNKIDATRFMPLSSIYDMDEFALQEVSNMTYPPTCQIMKEHVLTYDQKTFKIPDDSCTYILSSHCTENKKFAVLARNLKGSRTEVIVHVERHELVMSPARGEVYPVEFNHQKYQVDKKSPIVFDKKTGIHAYVIPVGNSKYHLVLKTTAGLKVVYDGENIKIQVSRLYKGELCGLCSEFDGEITREYRGVDQCLYVDSQDFAHSAITDANKCNVRTTPRFPRLCNDGRSTHLESSWEEDEDQYNRRDSEIRPKLRTVHVQKGQMVCFSTQPAYMCPEEAETKETESRTLDFHCLPKYDATTRKLLAESEHRILRELASKSVDFSETISIAKSCEQ